MNNKLKNKGNGFNPKSTPKKTLSKPSSLAEAAYAFLDSVNQKRVDVS